MPLDHAALMDHAFPEIEQSYTRRDTMLYALGVGYGCDPLDASELPFVYDRHPAFRAAPTMPVVLADDPHWVCEPSLGIDHAQVLHGEQSLELHRPLPPESTLVSRARIEEVADKGAGRGALIRVARELSDKATGAPLATARSTVFARGDGGFGGDRGSPRATHPIPARAPDVVVDFATMPQQALLYRLSGDWNPLHADPSAAAMAGFARPILHGLCTYGIAGRAVLQTFCDYEPMRFRALAVRFSSPVYPGETVRTEMWREGAVISLRARAVERDVVVLNNGRADIAG